MFLGLLAFCSFPGRGPGFPLLCGAWAVSPYSGCRFFVLRRLKVPGSRCAAYRSNPAALQQHIAVQPGFA